ncbi:transport protein SEC31, partial [Trifolium pratense]
ESASPQVPHSVPGVQYPDSYQQPFDPRYGSGYNTPVPHQQPQQPNLFVPSQATQVPQAPQWSMSLIELSVVTLRIDGKTECEPT